MGRSIHELKVGIAPILRRMMERVNTLKLKGKNAAKKELQYINEVEYLFYAIKEMTAIYEDLQNLQRPMPNAVDLEQAILGAVMLETLWKSSNLYRKNENGDFIQIGADEPPAIDRVRSFLRAEHFFDERHQLIYTAILELGTDPIDMRTVIHRLRRMEKIEEAGGAYYIAELTSKVSSAANIEYYARVVIEMAIKRYLIETANRIHEDGYEDACDVFALYDAIVERIDKIKKENFSQPQLSENVN